jgi:hypothetical protein
MLVLTTEISTVSESFVAMCQIEGKKENPNTKAPETARILDTLSNSLEKKEGAAG